MKIFIVLCLSAAVLGYPTEDETSRNSPALTHEETHNDNGEYTLHYITAEGIIVIEHGRLVPTLDGTDFVLIYDGEYSFVGDDGKIYTTKYTTDINGAHQPQGDHLPKAPEPLVYEQPELPKAPEPVTLKPRPSEIPPPPALPKAEIM